jgi:A/G-specific adenine glycosylase
VASARALVTTFAPLLVDWQRSHGRSTLPWQNTHDPYRVWLSEVMLQQTQVVTVLGYYARFLERFPTVAALAAAPEDEVLGLWSGLGYYSRARNLHRCAQEVVARFGGAFPRSATELATLPGIGRSTAAAIAAFCFGERVAILDGNVKRVLGRVLAFEGDLASAAQERLLWDAATELLPPEGEREAISAYTQGLMDLGATVCRGSPTACCARSRRCAGPARSVPRNATRSRRESCAARRRRCGCCWRAARMARSGWRSGRPPASGPASTACRLSTAMPRCWLRAVQAAMRASWICRPSPTC